MINFMENQITVYLTCKTRLPIYEEVGFFVFQIVAKKPSRFWEGFFSLPVKVRGWDGTVDLKTVSGIRIT